MNIAVYEGSAYLFLLVEMVTTDEIHLVFGVGRVLNEQLACHAPTEGQGRRI